jgi:activating signal cointegrator 1
MKALSLTQPWASLVAVGAKRIESRSWPTKYRGVIAIHASKGFPVACRHMCSVQPFLRELTRSGLSMPELPTGAIVAVATVIEVCLTGDWENYRNIERMVRLPGGRHFPVTPTENAFGDYGPGRFAWFLDRVHRVAEPVPCRGALGLWTVPDDVLAVLRERRVA